VRKGDAKRRIKLAISLLYFLARALSRFVLQALGHSPNHQLNILYYHGVPHAHRSNFARQMEALHRAARVWPSFYRGSLPLGKQNVAITFDDAYVSVAENALPELAARSFHSTIFVPVDSLGSHPTWAVENRSLDSDEIVMSAEMIATLPSSLVALGSHSNTHPHLSRIDPNDARNEIEGSRQKLQKLTGQDIRLFAFPYGDHDASILKLCRVAGYDYVFSITPHPVNTNSSDFVRGRVKVDPFDGPLEFFLKYNGAYAWVSQISSFETELKSILRRLQRSFYRRSIFDNKPTATVK
jgi:peptidoglycan/xylan/chitin deacetylase (PgdA/CDA1 family)